MRGITSIRERETYALNRDALLRMIDSLILIAQHLLTLNPLNGQAISILLLSS